MTNEQLQILREELAEEAYAELTDAEAAAELNTVRAARQLVPLWRIKYLGMTNGWWLPVMTIAEGLVAPTPVGQLDAATIFSCCRAVHEHYTDVRFENIDLDLTATQQVFAGLLAAGLVPAEQQAALSALADCTRSRADELGLPEVTEHHVAVARA